MELVNLLPSFEMLWLGLCVGVRIVGWGGFRSPVNGIYRNRVIGALWGR